MVRRVAAVASAALISRVTVLDAGFVWLDHAHIEGGLALAEPAEWLSLFTRGFAETGFYRPLMALSLSIDALLGGSARVFHATSIAWHAAAAVATMIAADALGASRRAALLAGILFAVHPVTTIVSDAIAFRSEAMIAVFLLGLVWAHTQRRPLLAACAVFLGALTKETALVLAPLFVVALELGPSTRTKDTRDRRRLFFAEAMGFAAAAALRLAFAPSFRATHAALALGDALGTRFASLSKSAAAVVLPIDRTVCDAFAVRHLWQVPSLAGIALAVALFAFAWRKRGAASLLALAILPSLQIVPVMRFWSPHYLYLPLSFATIVAADALERRAQQKATVVVAVAALVLGVVTLHDGRRYTNDKALFAPEVAAHRDCREAHFYLGEVERDGRRFAEAARHYEAALAERPGVLAYVDKGAALQNLGSVRLEQGRFAEARTAFRAALEGTRDPRARRELTHNLGAAALREGDAEQAQALLAEETARSDAMPASLHVRALALERLGRAEEARALRARLPAGARGDRESE